MIVVFAVVAILAVFLSEDIFRAGSDKILSQRIKRTLYILTEQAGK